MQTQLSTVIINMKKYSKNLTSYYINCLDRAVILKLQDFKFDEVVANFLCLK